jgi:hypothetical protein
MPWVGAEQQSRTLVIATPSKPRRQHSFSKMPSAPDLLGSGMRTQDGDRSEQAASNIAESIKLVSRLGCATISSALADSAEAGDSGDGGGGGDLQGLKRILAVDTPSRA